MDKNNNIIEHFLKQAELVPNEVAIENDSLSLTFKDFKHSIISYTHYLDDLNVANGSKVLILHPASIDLFAAIIALLGKACTVVFVEEWSKISDIETCCNNVHCDYILTNSKGKMLKWFYPSLRKLKSIGLKYSKNISYKDFVISKVSAETAAIISFSSGSSGTSKAVVRTHGILNAQFEALKKHILIEPKSKMCTNFPVVILLNLGIGISTYLSASVKMSNLRKSHIHQLYSDLKMNAITHLAFSPYIVRNLARYIRINQKEKLYFKQIITGGSPIYPVYVEEFIKSFNCDRIEVLYGSSEAEPIAFCLAPEIIEFGNQTGLFAGRIDTVTNCMIGSITEGVYNPANIEDKGEILVSGSHVVKEYVNSEKAFLQNKILINSILWHRTGDYGVLNSNGDLMLHGNPKYSYNNICVFEIEKRLSQIEGIEFATIVSKIAFVQKYPNSSKKSIQDEIKLLFPEILKIKFVSLPLDKRHNGKIKYQLLVKDI